MDNRDTKGPNHKEMKEEQIILGVWVSEFAS